MAHAEALSSFLQSQPVTLGLVKAWDLMVVAERLHPLKVEGVFRTGCIAELDLMPAPLALRPAVPAPNVSPTRRKPSGFPARQHQIVVEPVDSHNALVVQSMLSREGQQREPAASVFSENLSFLFGGEVASGWAGLR